MARAPAPAAAAKIDWNPILKLISIGLTVIFIILAGAGAYWSIINRLDRTDDRIFQQGQTLKTLAESIRTLADEALTAADLRAACMQMQIQNKGWVCPFSGVEVKPSRTRVLSVRAKKSEAPDRTN